MQDTVTVGVLGCGYVGLEVCRQLRSTNKSVIGVRRSDSGIEAIASTGATPIQADLTDPTTLDAIPPVNTIIFAASSGGGSAADARDIFINGLRNVIEHFGNRSTPPQKLVYTSSTGVYGDHGGDWVDETTPLSATTDKTAVLIEAEKLARTLGSTHGMDPTVVRLAGIYGPDRYRLQRYLNGPVTAGYLNHIHQTDAARVIRFVIDKTGVPTILGVDSEPVDKWEFADWLAAECGRDPPPKQTKEERLEEGNLSERTKRRITSSKRCSNARLENSGFTYHYPTYREGYQDAIQTWRSDTQ